MSYIPTHKEFELEYYRDLSGEERCEHDTTTDEYMKLYNYCKWVEDQLSKRVDMTMRKGYRR